MIHTLQFLVVAIPALSGIGCGEQYVSTTTAGVHVPKVDAVATADTVYTNGRIYTVNEVQPWAEAVAIKDGKFIIVGSNAEVRALVGDRTEVIDLSGRFVMPGLIDVHAHPLGAAEGRAALGISDPTDVDAILEQLRQFAADHPDLAGIRGEPWNLGVFGNDSPRKELLDAIVPDRPVYLLSQTGHSAWVNSAALELAGINKDTPQTAKFIFDTDPETGEPSGTVREFAMGAMEQVMARAAPERYAPALREVVELYNGHGFTTIKAAEGAATWLEGAAYLEKKGGLTVRLFAAWDWRTSHYLSVDPNSVDALIDSWENYRTEMIQCNYVKMFFDGGPDSYTAYLLEDYVGRPGHKGSPNLPRAEFKRHIKAFLDKGISVQIHVLGDAGGRELGKIFAEISDENPDNDVLMHFSHAWMTRPEDFSRLAQANNVCVDFSPVLCYPAPEIEGSMAPPVGEERYHQFFNVRAAIESGVPVGFGSDWPSALIPDPNGFHQMQSWITRRDPADPDGPTLNAEQGITLKQVIRGFTIGGAECLGFGWDEKLGSIEPGKLADFIVIDQNLFEVPTNDIHKTNVLRTIMGGEVVYERAHDGEIEFVDEDDYDPTSRYISD